MTVLVQIQRRAASDAQFGSEIRTALAHGGLPAAASVARAHGFDVPALEPGSDELSDLELELIAGGKGLPEAIGGIGAAAGTAATLGLFGWLL
ncbi:MAG: hypothetical protein RIC55_11405 [Pirellulaceae bacterium]